MNAILLILILFAVGFGLYQLGKATLLGMTFRVAVKALYANKGRSFLSMLGIIIGVAAVIVMMGIGQGSKEMVRANISQMASEANSFVTIVNSAQRII